MVQIAKVKNTNGKHCEIEVSRKAMCDGCHKSDCGSGCPMSGLFSLGRSMTAFAVNKAGASVGDTVEIETSDKSILLTAAAVFVLPIICGGIFYATAYYFRLDSIISAILAIIGFVIPFLFLKIAENQKKDREPSIIVARILKEDTHSDSADTL